MIERKFVSQTLKEHSIQEFISETLKNVGHSHTEVLRTPLGERIVIYASRPGLVVGRKGENIKKLTGVLKKRFGLENPQIEISEVSHPELDAQIVAERIASTLERFGIQRFKAIGHKMLEDVTKAGARGIEICISGKVPSARARTWRFYKGYLKKSGDIALTKVKRAMASANLKSGTVGIRVAIMPGDVALPDDVTIVADSSALQAAPEQKAGEAVEGKAAEHKEEKKDDKPKRRSAPRKAAGPRRRSPKSDKTQEVAGDESKTTA